MNKTTNKTAFITGITGQCGSYLAELLLEKGYKVHGLIMQTVLPETKYLDQYLRDDRIELHHGDMSDFSSILNAIKKAEPDEIYNLAAQSHAGISFNEIEHSGNITGLGVGRVLEAARIVNPKIKIWQASTSEMLGGKLPWNEQSSMRGNNPYGCAKIYGHYIAQNYRESYGMFVCCGIMFNNESPRRAENFVTRKITKAVAEIKKGIRKELLLGNIESKRDWGFSKEYMEAAWMMMQAGEPKDYVIATGESHSVREWMEASFEIVGLNAYDYYKQDERFMRPSDMPDIRGDSSLIKKELGWEARTKYKDLVKIMVEADML